MREIILGRGCSKQLERLKQVLEYVQSEKFMKYFDQKLKTGNTKKEEELYEN